MPRTSRTATRRPSHSVPPAAYIESARIEVARNRLESTDDTVAWVAAACGFGTVDTLNRAFRRALGVTPTEYRQRFRVRV